MAKSLSNAKTGKERIKHIGRIGRAYPLAKPFCRCANAICKENEVGEWGSGGVRKWRNGGEERSGLDKRRRVAPKGRVGIARLGRLALEFRGNCAAERIKPLARLRADRNNSDGCCSRYRSTALRPKTMASRFLLSSDCRA